jgi:hypothetical protein
MAVRSRLLIEDKLAALRKGDPIHDWESLDDKRFCILCDRTFNGRQVTISISRLGRVQLHCPTDGCRGTAHQWVHPGNPLTSQEAWTEWERVMRESNTSAAPRVARI